MYLVAEVNEQLLTSQLVFQPTAGVSWHSVTADSLELHDALFAFYDCRLANMHTEKH